MTQLNLQNSLGSALNAMRSTSFEQSGNTAFQNAQGMNGATGATQNPLFGNEAEKGVLNAFKKNWNKNGDFLSLFLPAVGLAGAAAGLMGGSAAQSVSLMKDLMKDQETYHDIYRRFSGAAEQEDANGYAGEFVDRLDQLSPAQTTAGAFSFFKNKKPGGFFLTQKRAQDNARRRSKLKAFLTRPMDPLTDWVVADENRPATPEAWEAPRVVVMPDENGAFSLKPVWPLSLLTYNDLHPELRDVMQPEGIVDLPDEELEQKLIAADFENIPAQSLRRMLDENRMCVVPAPVWTAGKGEWLAPENIRLKDAGDRRRFFKEFGAGMDTILETLGYPDKDNRSLVPNRVLRQAAIRHLGDLKQQSQERYRRGSLPRHYLGKKVPLALKRMGKLYNPVAWAKGLYNQLKIWKDRHEKYGSFRRTRTTFDRW